VRNFASGPLARHESARAPLYSSLPSMRKSLLPPFTYAASRRHSLDPAPADVPVVAAHVVQRVAIGIGDFAVFHIQICRTVRLQAFLAQALCPRPSANGAILDDELFAGIEMQAVAAVGRLEDEALQIDEVA